MLNGLAGNKKTVTKLSGTEEETEQPDGAFAKIFSQNTDTVLKINTDYM